MNKNVSNFRFPDWGWCRDKIKLGEANPLEIFIYNNTPALQEQKFIDEFKNMIEFVMQKEDDEVKYLVSSKDKEKCIADKIYLAIWENPGYLPNPVDDAFRESLVKTAMEICHETGTEDSYIQFCVETIKDWIKNTVYVKTKSN